MNNIEEFHTYFHQGVLHDAEGRGLLRHQAFFENVCEDLSSTGDLTKNYTAANYYKTGIEINGYDYDEDRNLLKLLVHEYFQDETIQTLTKKDVETKFKRLSKFFKKSVEGLYKELEETTEAFDASWQVYQWIKDKKVDTLQLILISDGKATKAMADLPNEKIGDLNVVYKVIDVDYLYKTYLSENSSGDFTVDKINLPALKVNSDSEDYQSYLTVINGHDIVAIYEKYGQKLFEQNVRTFLQFKGGVNKGLRNTIKTQPGMFFAYNNGLTATASDVEIDGAGCIVAIHNFQIVNGGQTTSSIYAAFKNSQLDVSEISVQMKLTVVSSNTDHGNFVSKVSEYANTQNKVNKSDFFSNSSFHKEFKAFSKYIWVPASSSRQKRTLWYYERVRGEYLNEQAYLTNANKTKFLSEYPKSQLFDKTFLSKSENSWLQKPHVVSKGAQYSFKEFADSITDQLELDSMSLTEKYFRDTISRVILFRKLEKLVSEAEWYAGGFRANAVTYTIAYLAMCVDKGKKNFNFHEIWELQDIPKDLYRVLDVIGREVYSQITSPPANFANVAQWCKREECWKELKKKNINIQIPDRLLISDKEEQFIKRSEKKEKKLIKGIEMQSFVVQIKQADWLKLYEYFNENFNDYSLSITQLGILETTATRRLKVPSEKQSKILYELYMLAKADSFVL